MKCRICDKTLTEAEILVPPDGVGFEPCSVCMEVIMDAAYCDGFVREDPLDDPDLDDQFGDGSVEVLDSDTFYSLLNPDDIGFQESFDFDS